VIGFVTSLAGGSALIEITAVATALWAVIATQIGIQPDRPQAGGYSHLLY
jgi:hypothetical protein